MARKTPREKQQSDNDNWSEKRAGKVWKSGVLWGRGLFPLLVLCYAYFPISFAVFFFIFLFADLQPLIFRAVLKFAYSPWKPPPLDFPTPPPPHKHPTTWRIVAVYCISISKLIFCLFSLLLFSRVFPGLFSYRFFFYYFFFFIISSVCLKAFRFCFSIHSAAEQWSLNEIIG